MIIHKMQPPHKIQRTNSLVEIDSNNSTMYFFVPPFHPKQHDFHISRSKDIKTSVGQIKLDFCGDMLAGIEIPNGLTDFRQI